MRVAQSRGNRYGNAALASEFDKCSLAAQGFRHSTHFDSAVHIGQLVAGGELNEDYAFGQVVAMGLAIGLSQSEAQRQTRNGFRMGAQKPRRAPSDGQMVRDATDARLHLIAWWQAVQAEVRDPMTLKLLAAFAMLGMRAEKLRLSESLREIAEAAGVSPQTVSNRRKSLMPWIRLVERGSRSDGARSIWQLVTPTPSLDSPSGPGSSASGLSNKGVAPKPALTCDVPRSDALEDPSRDEWYRNPTRWRIWTLMSTNEEVTPHQLAEATGRSLKTIRKILTQMRKDGLVHYTGSGWLRTSENPQVMPYMFSPGERRKQRHQEQRVNYKRGLWHRKHLVPDSGEAA